MSRKTKPQWPCRRYGPGGVSKVCHTPEDVPLGWASSPTAFEGEEQTPTEENIDGWTRTALEQVIRQGGGRVLARDTLASLYKRADKAGYLATAEDADEEDLDENGIEKDPFPGLEEDPVEDEPEEPAEEEAEKEDEAADDTFED